MARVLIQSISGYLVEIAHKIKDYLIAPLFFVI
jgi:hypothetical protein